MKSESHLYAACKNFFPDIPLFPREASICDVIKKIHLAPEQIYFTVEQKSSTYKLALNCIDGQ